jgi:hypothetical protein
MSDNAEVTRAATENGVEELRVTLLGDVLNGAVVINQTDLDNVIAKETKTTTELTIATSLAVTTGADVGTLSMRHE